MRRPCHDGPDIKRSLQGSPVTPSLAPIFTKIWAATFFPARSIHRRNAAVFARHQSRLRGRMQNRAGSVISRPNAARRFIARSAAPFSQLRRFLESQLPCLIAIPPAKDRIEPSATRHCELLLSMGLVGRSQHPPPGAGPLLCRSEQKKH